MVKRNAIATKLTKICTQTQKRAFDVAVAWKHVWVVSLFAKFQRTSLLNHFHPHDDLCNLCGKLGNRSDIRHTASFHRNCKPLPLFYIQIKPQRFRVCKVNLGRTFRIPGSGSMSLLVHDL